MNGIEVTVNINLNGEKMAGITTGEQAAETLPPGDVGREVTQEEEQRFAVASDLANVCEYLEDSEVIKIRLIVNKAQARKDRAEKGDENDAAYSSDCHCSSYGSRRDGHGNNSSRGSSKSITGLYEREGQEE